MDLNRAYAETFGFVGDSLSQRDPGDETERDAPVFAREPLTDALLDELRPLLEKHWEEIAVHKDIPLDPDYDRYFRMANAGALHPFVVRVNGRIVGYAPFIVTPHLHYRTSKWAQNDIIWIAPEHRRAGLGMALVSFVIAYLKRQDVQVISIDAKAAHPELSALLDGMKFSRVEIGHQLRIG
jgi:GNAT superfamily N-acetyltransferase